MMSCGFLLRVFMAILLCIDVFSHKCLTEKSCPVQAVRISTPEGVKCVCKGGFFGDKCQFRALQSTTSSSNDNNNKDRCPWYKCPGQSFGFIQFSEDFNKPCFKKGVVIGVATGVLGSVIISVLIYITIRFCVHFRETKKKSKSHFSCGNEPPKSTGQDFFSISDTNSPSPSVTIDIPDTEILQEKASNVDTQLEDDRNSKNNKSAKAVTISVPENEVARALHEAGSVCIDVGTDDLSPAQDV